MKRITVEMVKEAYAKTGLKPKQAFFYTREYENDSYFRCACGIGAVYTSETGRVEPGEAELYGWEVYGEEYVAGFTFGFDGDPSLLFQSDEWRAGFEDGRAAWEAVKP